MASPDQTDVQRPFRQFLDPVKKRWGETGVPEIHQPLGSAAWSEVTADGADAVPGDLVLDSRGRWCLVWNDALGARAERS